MKKYKQYRHKKLGYVVERIEHGNMYKGEQYYRDIADNNFVLSEWFLIHSGEWEEIVEKPVLFTTFDGKDIHLGDTYWVYCPTSPSIIKACAKKVGGWDTKSKLPDLDFSTQEVAENYVLYNKKLLSLNDLLDVWNGGFPSHESRELYESSPMFQDFKKKAIENNIMKNKKSKLINS